MIFNEQILSSAVVLFLVMDPLGNIPIFLSVLKDVDEKRRWKIILRELFIALGILFIFLYFGQNLLNLLHLQSESVSIAGGIILFLIGLKMIFPSRHGGVMGTNFDGEPLIVPLAIPLIAGPSALATLMLLVGTDPSNMVGWLSSLLIAWLSTAIILMLAPVFFKVLRRRGLAAMERLMGMILIMIAVQMLLNGIKSVL